MDNQIVVDMYNDAVAKEILHIHATANDQRTILKGLPDDLPEPHHISLDILSRASLVYSYDKLFVVAIENIMIGHGWRKVYDVGENDLTSKYDEVRAGWIKEDGNHTMVTIKFTDDTPGATCKKVKIGQTTKTVDVFEYQCNQGE